MRNTESRYVQYKQLYFIQKKLYTKIHEQGSSPLFHLINMGKEYAGLLPWATIKVGIFSINNFILTIWSYILSFSIWLTWKKSMQVLFYTPICLYSLFNNSFNVCNFLNGLRLFSPYNLWRKNHLVFIQYTFKRCLNNQYIICK
jgi:hypothetical protein